MLNEYFLLKMGKIELRKEVVNGQQLCDSFVMIMWQLVLICKNGGKEYLFVCERRIKYKFKFNKVGYIMI